VGEGVCKRGSVPTRCLVGLNERREKGGPPPRCRCGYTPARWRHPALPLVGDATPWSSSFVTSRLERPLVVVVVVVVAVVMVACRCIGSNRGGGRSQGGSRSGGGGDQGGIDWARANH